MLPQFYQTHLRSVLNTNQYILLNLLIELLQGQKQVRLERLATNLPLPIQFESRRRQLQRFLISPNFGITQIWFALIKYLLTSYFSTSKELIIVVDRTQWRELNILMVSLVWNQRAIPLNWQILSRKDERFWGELFLPKLSRNSNFVQQQALFTTVLPLLKDYKVTVLGSP